MSDDAFAWECSKCGTVNGIHRNSCVTCGNGIYKSQAAEQDTPPAERDYAKAAWEFLKATALKPAERPTPITDADNSINSIMARHEANGSPPHMILADVMLRAIGLERQLAEAREQASHWKAQCQRGFNVAAIIEQRDRLADALEAMREYYRGHMITPALYNRVEKALAAVKGGPQ